MDDTATDLLPLRTDFDTVFRGYDRDQLRQYIQASERDTHLVVADRDAALSQVEDLSRELASARTTIRQLQSTVDRISRTPIDPAALSDRLRRMVELATADAQETTRRAQAAADRTWRHAEDTAARLAERHREFVVAGAVHASFTDLALVAEQFGLDIGATLPAARALEITRTCVRAFAGVHLRGVQRPFLDGPSAHHREVIACAPRK